MDNKRSQLKLMSDFFKHGSIDQAEIQQKAINIIEGGKDAFDRRNSIYQTWKH